MPDDQESRDLLSSINDIWGGTGIKFRRELSVKTYKPHSRQQVHYWRHHGIPRKYRRMIRAMIEEKTP